MKPCPSFPGYSATEEGVVYSHRRGRMLPGGGKTSFVDPDYRRPLKGTRGQKGYMYIGVTLANGERRPIGMHRLVADAFSGPCPDGMQVRHLDDNPDNNKASNLAYGTIADNANDRRRNGGYASGARHHNAKLTEEQVLAIILSRENGEKVRAIASAHAVSVSTIEAIIYRKTYKCISPSRRERPRP